MRSKKIIDIFNYKQRLLSIDMKTKVVQHVSRIKLDNQTTLLVPSACLTFRHFQLGFRPYPPFKCKTHQIWFKKEIKNLLSLISDPKWPKMTCLHYIHQWRGVRVKKQVEQLPCATMPSTRQLCSSGITVPADDPDIKLASVSFITFKFWKKQDQYSCVIIFLNAFL